MAPFDPKSFLSEGEGGFDPKAFLAEGEEKPKEEPKEERGGIKEVVRPFTTYGQAQYEKQREARQGITQGIERLTKPTGGDILESAKSAVLGPLEIAGGALGYVASPLTGAYRSFVSRPLAETTGLPKEYTEFAMEMATPVLGLTKTPRIPIVTRAPKKGPEAEASRIFEKQIEAKGGSPQEVRERLESPTQPREIVPGSEPTTFQLTGDPGLGQIERGTEVRHAGEMNTRRAQQNLRRLEAIEEAQPTGSPVDLAAHVRRAQENEARILEGEVQAADQRAREVARLPGGGVDPATHGNVMRQELENAAEVERAREGAFWRQVDPNGVLRLDPNPLQRVEREIYGVMPEGGAAEASLSPAEKQISEIIQNYQPNIPLRELNDLNGLLSSRMREELWQNGRSLAYGRMSRLRQGIADAEEGVFGQLGERDATLPQRLREARDATRQRAERFNQAPISDVLQRQGTQGPYKVQPAQITDKLLPQGNKGYDVAQSYLRASPQSLDVYTEALSAKMAREVIRPDGSVDPRALEGFVTRHSGVLRAISERDGGNFARSLQNIQGTQERLAAAQASRQAMNERFASEELGKLIGATDPAHVENIIGSIFNRIDAVPRAQELARLVAGNPAAQDGLRRAVINHLNTRFIGTMEAGNTEANMIRASMFQKFVRDKAPVLRQLMTPEQVKVLEAVAADITRTNRTIGTKIPGGSNSVQDLYNLTQQQGFIGRTVSKLGGAVMHLALKKVLGPFGGKWAYETGAAGLNVLKGKAQEQAVENIQQMIDRAMLDPDYAKELLSKGYRTVVKPGTRARASGGSVFAAGGFGGQPRDAAAFGGSGQASQGPRQAPQNGRSQTYQAGGTVVQISKRADGGDVETETPMAARPTVAPIGPSVVLRSKAMPDDEDVALSQKYDRTYGDPVAGFIKPGGASVSQLPIPDVETAVNRGGKLNVPAGMGTPTPVSPEEADRIHRGWMAAERSALAKLGFQPRSMSVSPPAGPQGPRLTAFGLYDPNTNQSWYDASSPTSAVHESMHRGLQKLREAGVFPKGLPEEELYVRAMMDRHLTEPTSDPKTGQVYTNRVKQLNEAKRRVRPEDLDAIENAAAWLVAKKRPGGPRADGGDVGEAQQAQPGSSDRYARLIMGQTGGQNFAQLMAGKKTKAPTGVSREDIVRQLRGRGLSGEGWEAPSGTDYESRVPYVDSRATGGGIDPDYATGDRRSIVAEDPSEQGAADTFADRFGAWQDERVGKQKVSKPDPIYKQTVEEEDKDVGARVMIPGQRNPSGLMDRQDAYGMAGGGLLRSGIESILMPTRRAATRELSRPVRDLPQKTLTVGGEPFTPRPSPEVRGLAQQYMEEKGLPYRTLENYVPVNVPRAKAIAREYDIMPHIPEDPSIQRAYDALARETRDQYEMLQRAGKYKFEPFKPGPVGSDPYAANPRLAQKDFLENRHMYYFPSEQGFGLPGEEAFAKANPMMAPSGVKIEGKEVPFNDLFRVVHDVFGHHKEGFGFRAAGEENAWRSHGRMYSPEALPAMTAETRGQNSWVNFGPHAEFNKTASGADTIYAPQKIGRLPDWVIHSGRLTPLGVAGLTALPEGEEEKPEKKARGGLVYLADGGDTEDDSEAFERAAQTQRRGVLGAETMQGRGRPGDKFFESPSQKETAQERIWEFAVPQTPLDWGLLALGGPFRWPIKAAALGIGAMMEPSEAQAGKTALAKKAVTGLFPKNLENAYRPGIYKDPREIAREAAERVPPEHPALHRLFNVHREDLYDIGQQGRRQGNLPDPPWVQQPAKARGSAAAEGVMTPRNEQRILDVMGEAEKYPQLKLADAWYVMDPAYQQLEHLHGPELAKRLYARLNTSGAMTSPSSDVMSELNRGSAANMMIHQGRFQDWLDWAGIAQKHRPGGAEALSGRGEPFVPVPGKGGTSPNVAHLAGRKFPPELSDVVGHYAHTTAHGRPIEDWLRTGVVDMGSAKVPVYIDASGVPQTGFQTRWMVPDAHISRSTGMGDTRTPGIVRQGASMSMPEYRQIGPWYRERISNPLGVEAVPAQARQWTVFGPQTGVDTDLGVPKLELMARRIYERAMREGWSPEQLRDAVLSGGAHMFRGGLVS